MTYNIITLGCSKNTVDSENIAGHLTANGNTVYFDRLQNDCDVIAINTCGFIGDAKEESINEIFNQIAAKKRSRKKKYLVVFGCLSERYRKILADEMPEVDAWFGSHQWSSLIQYLLTIGNTAANTTARRKHILTAERKLSTPKHYAYLKISEGCNRKCSYCAIPLIRGNHTSRPIDDIINESKKLVSQGVKELIVIAQDTTYYGLDIYGKRCLGTLLNRLSDESGATWIRLHYTYPASFPTDAIEAIRQHDNICNYIDIPLQHINSRILHSMNRGIDRDGTLSLLSQFRQQLPDAAIRTTLIVGYPGESHEDFEELKAFVQQARFDRMGCFAYSPEEGTPAETLGDPISEEEKQRRVSELMEVQEQISLEKNQQRIGSTQLVVIDRKEGDFFIGRTQYDSPDVDDEVLISSHEKLKIGEFYHAIITDAMENDLIGKIVS
ncbi:MAG: 30S ribosomal protein S12 methylthiotransferase RimO [Bacteroidales bacterium]|nr:30S ribosomal protein S12 methylthiotransferase RimO [Candidatus Colimorpha onthohippi]